MSLVLLLFVPYKHNFLLQIGLMERLHELERGLFLALKLSDLLHTARNWSCKGALY